MGDYTNGPITNTLVLGLLIPFAMAYQTAFIKTREVKIVRQARCSSIDDLMGVGRHQTTDSQPKD